MENRTIHHDHRKWKVIVLNSKDEYAWYLLIDFLDKNAICNSDGFHLPCHPTEALNVKRNLHLLLVEAG